MRVRVALVVVSLTGLLAGCGLEPVPPADEPAATAITADQDGTDSPEEFTADIEAAREIAAEYWGERLGAGFEPIKDLIAYEQEGDVACAGQPLPRNNAVYCSAGDFIAYDVNWAYAAFQQVGDAFLFYLLGHEYAHGIQARLGIQKQFTIEQELQADCMAGAFIGDKVRDDRLRMQDNDTQELADGLEAVGDQPGQPWFAEGSHGTAEQRMQSFASGYEKSLAACGLS
ncbi:neutral zinc metallopeptidase [Actinoplanes sp. DH11]|uniref:neutral zinc metallopeptidase n=1 Tax=Actinoplanes sp. DH11 TaxID=2857011 RepID=UPI001E33F7F0|nr:neutral zinc metallopeptidase [Actinoplanes sp. DH11]